LIKPINALRDAMFPHEWLSEKEIDDTLKAPAKTTQFYAGEKFRKYILWSLAVSEIRHEFHTGAGKTSEYGRHNRPL
jgi:hypothetical protein